MSEKNLTKLTQKIMTCKAFSPYITSYTTDEKRENITSVVVEFNNEKTEFKPKVMGWSTDCFLGFADLIVEIIEAKSEIGKIRAWRRLQAYDMSHAVFDGLGTDTVRKYIKDSYRFGKTFIDMVRDNKALVICSEDFAKRFESIRPEKMHAVLYKGYYITEGIYKMIKSVYGE